MYNGCGGERGATPRGVLRSEPFLLAGDTVAVRLGGASSPDSAYVLLRDTCTGAAIVRFGGVGPALEPRAGHAGSFRGHFVQWEIADLLDRPGGWIGADDLEERASSGLPPVPDPPVVSWIRPAGGENFSGGSKVNLRWSASSSTGLDSLVLYLTFDNGSTLRRQAVIDGGREYYRWTAPDTVAMGARLRLVGYARAGGASCATCEPFSINIVIGADPATAPEARAGLRATYARDGVWLEGGAHGDASGTSRLELFDARGRRLATLWRGRAGERFRVAVPEADARGRRLGSGIYFARLGDGARGFSTTFFLAR